MSRPLRIEFLDAWYHVLNWGRRGESIFRDARDYQIFLQTIQEACEVLHFRVAAYCLLFQSLPSFSSASMRTFRDMCHISMVSTPKGLIAATVTMVRYSGTDIRRCSLKLIRIFSNWSVIFIVIL